MLFDENKSSSDDLQRLTYNLCYMYQRYTRSVSVVLPVYYAHLITTHAQFFLSEVSDGDSTVSSSGLNTSFEFMDLHKNLLNYMFFV